MSANDVAVLAAWLVIGFGVGMIVRAIVYYPRRKEVSDEGVRDVHRVPYDHESEAGQDPADPWSTTRDL